MMAKGFWAFAAAVALLAAAASGQSKQGTPTVYTTTTGTISGSSLWIDASQFSSSDVCVGIQSAIASAVTQAGSVAGGLVIDARNFALPTSGPYVLTCSVNPFTLAGNTNPLVLVTGGLSDTTPGSAGGVVLLPGATIAVGVPWLVPQSWSVIGQGASVTVLAPAPGFPTPPTGGTVTVSSSSSAVSVTTPASWGTSVVGAVLLACPSGCTASFTNATVAGIVTDRKTSMTANLGTNAQASFSGGGYLMMEPLIAWATTAQGTTIGALQTNTTGSVIQDIGLDCSQYAGGSSYPTGCLPFWDQYGQERSQLKRIRITNFGSSAGTNPLGIGIYSATAQNGGPFEDIQMATASVAAANVCVEVGGVVAGNQPSMRGIRGLTCTGPAGESSTAGTGVDVNTQNFSLSDAHFEAVEYGVNVGSLTSARGIFLNDVTGGGATGAYTTNVVYISSTCASSGTGCPYPTSDVKISNVFQPFTASPAGPALVDTISGSGSHTTSELTLGLYSLGDGSGSGAGSTRPVLTTSSSIASTPYLPGTLPAGTPISGVQGTSGTLVQMSTGSATSGDLIKFDGSGDAVDSGVSSTSPTFSGTATVGTLAATTISGSPNFSGTPTFSTTLALNTTGTSGGLTGTPNITVGTVTATGITGSYLNQTAASAYGGTCTMTSATSCSFTLGHAPTTAVCVSSEQGTGTVLGSKCSVSALGVVTITASSTNSQTWGALVFGNPN